MSFSNTGFSQIAVTPDPRYNPNAARYRPSHPHDGRSAVTVYLIRGTHRDLIVRGISVCETIRHDEIKHVGRVKPLDPIGVRFTGLQLIRVIETLFVLRERDIKPAGLGVFHVQIDQ